MQQQDVAIVLQIAKSGVDLKQFQRHSELLELNQEGALTLEEQLELTAAYSCETRSAIGKILVESNNPIIQNKNRGFKDYELRTIAKLIEDNREILLEAWNDYFDIGS